ncbi:MAG TPA: hypothetical protein VFE17_12020, partial [Candidatus Baltobacteraceae bacterium]|nr:hypothetical protein [Candidatus Baltobacteraceae bacterium]
MNWARTVVVDAQNTGALREHIEKALQGEGLSLTFGPHSTIDRTYVLMEARADIDPAELPARLPEGRWYDEPIIALAIEPAPQDALLDLMNALGGPGAPAGVSRVDRFGAVVVTELRPSITPVRFVLQTVDVELGRYHGFRRSQLLAPLPAQVLAAIAADGLQAPDVT